MPVTRIERERREEKSEEKRSYKRREVRRGQKLEVRRRLEPEMNTITPTRREGSVGQEADLVDTTEDREIELHLHLPRCSRPGGAT